MFSRMVDQKSALFALSFPDYERVWQIRTYAQWNFSKRLHALLKTLNHTTNHASNEDSRILIFVLYKREADRVLETLKYIGFTAAAIHGDMGQAARMTSLDQFKTGKTGLLVATDVAARGLDIPNVGAVINYSFPLTIEGTLDIPFVSSQSNQGRYLETLTPLSHQ